MRFNIFFTINFVDGERLNDFVVYATSTPPSVELPPSPTGEGSTLCFSYPGVAEDEEVIEEACADGTKGQYLVVQMNGAEQILTLCEVEVYGGEKPC